MTRLITLLAASGTLFLASCACPKKDCATCDSKDKAACCSKGTTSKSACSSCETKKKK